MSLLTAIGAAASAWTGSTAKARAFDRVDADDDRRVDAAELQSAFDAVAAKTGKPARDAEATIAKIDRNGDGEVSRIEIRAHLRDLRPPPASTVELARRGDGTAG
jgi:hypothetical protein